MSIATNSTRTVEELMQGNSLHNRPSEDCPIPMLTPARSTKELVIIHQFINLQNKKSAQICKCSKFVLIVQGTESHPVRVVSSADSANAKGGSRTSASNFSIPIITSTMVTTGANPLVQNTTTTNNNHMSVVPTESRASGWTDFNDDDGPIITDNAIWIWIKNNC